MQSAETKITSGGGLYRLPNEPAKQLISHSCNTSVGSGTRVVNCLITCMFGNQTELFGEFDHQTKSTNNLILFDFG